MASLFGALGSLAESYGLARQQLQENALAEVRQRVEERYADIAQQRLAEEQQELKQRQQQSDFQKQEFEWRKQQALLQQQRDENTLQDLGLPISYDSSTGEQRKLFYRPFKGDWLEKRVPGTGVTGADSQQYINDVSQNDPEFRRYLTTEAHRLSLENQGNQRPVLEGLGKIADAYLKEKRAAAAKAGKTSASKANVQAGLQALKTSVSQLESRLGVLDDFWGGLGMAAAGVGQRTKAEGGLITGPLGAVATRLGYGQMNDDQKEYIRQLNMAIGQIPVMREFFGKGTRAQASVDLLARDLPDPQTTPSSKDGRRKIELVKQEIQIIERALAEEAAGTTTAPGAAPTARDILQQGAINLQF